MEVWAVRHGQSEYNLLGLCNDDPNKQVSLTDEGRLQAARAAALMIAAPFDAAFSSPLPRAVQTAEILLAGRILPLRIEPRLADIRSGFDGKPVNDYFAATAHDPLHARVNGGESLLDHKARVGGFLNWLAVQPYHCVLLVAHEETLRVFRARADSLIDEQLRELHFANCEPYRFSL